MFNKISLMLNKNHPLVITIILPIAMVFHLGISSDVLFYISFCLFFGYQQRKKLSDEIKVLKEEVANLRTINELANTPNKIDQKPL